MTSQDRPTDTPRGPIDGQRIQELRLKHGIARHVLGRRIGGSATVIANLEDTDGASTRITVQQLVLLAHLLDVPVSTLFHRIDTAPQPVHPLTNPTAQEDTARLGAFLAQDRRRRRVPATSICVTFGWTLDRLNAAATALTAQLPHLGMRLERANGTLRVSPVATDQAEADAVAEIRRIDNHLGLDKTPAQIAWLIYNNGYTVTRGRAPADDRAAIDTLIKRGIVERDGLAYRCTDAFRDAFT